MLREWLAAHREPAYYSSSSGLLKGGALDLGSPEPPPQGVLRRAGYHCRQAWRRCKAEFWAEWPLLKPRLWVIIPLLIFQYVHAIFTGMAYYMHTPLPEDNTTLHDLGFEVLPYLSVDAVSEILVYIGFAQFFIWLVSPFVTRRKSFYAAVVLKRVLVILVSCQVLRILTFLSTQLPAPAPHCRAPEPTSNVPWPVWWKVIIVDVARQASKGCGDLIFSSHITFIFTFCWTYAVMGHSLLLKAWAFLYSAATALCIIASRKHYTVDITVACYVIPLVFFHYYRRWTTVRDDICTADNCGIVSLVQSLPVVSAPSQTNGGSRPGSSGGSSTHGSKADGRGGAAAARRARDSAAGGGGLGTLPPGDAVIDVEMVGASSALLDDHAGPDSPTKGALSALAAALPRRISSHAGAGANHRRTDSQEPVLAREDQSASSFGP